MIRVQVDLSDVIRKTRRLRKRQPIATAQELNRQRRRSRTLQTRQLSARLGIKPQRRIRRRILLPRAGAATPRRLRALGLTLVEALPARYFSRSGPVPSTYPGGSRVRNDRPTASDPFRGTNTSGNRDVFRRRSEARLPVDVVLVDASEVGYSIRERVLEQLARDWPGVWENRMRREIARAFR